MEFQIKAVVMDIDGVIVGEKKGYNSPYPNNEVIKALSLVKQKGVIVSFCTGKPYLSVKKIIDDADLYNLHITDGGAVLMDPVSEDMLFKQLVSSKDAQEIISAYVKAGEYMEFYSPTEYFIQKSQKCDITDKHTFVLQKAPIQVKDLATEALLHPVTKIMVITRDEKECKKPAELFKKYFNTKLNLRWGLHPVVNPLQFGVITDKKIDKGKMLKRLAKEYSLELDNFLAIGDSTSDWAFMKYAGYVAAPVNCSTDLKEFIKARREKGFIGKHVDDNGIIDVLARFGLLQK